MRLVALSLGRLEVKTWLRVHSMAMDVERAFTYKISVLEKVIFKLISPALT